MLSFLKVMIDRISNLLVLFIFSAALLILSLFLKNAWDYSEPLEKQWVLKTDAHPKNTVDELLGALYRAEKADDEEAVRYFRNRLETDYKPSDEILVRFNSNELVVAAVASSVPLLFLIIPLSLNYIRHGKLKVWNSTT
tara:strand:- start:8563 stop:8979 length:417 start_codon:yes stop_codon:yes gene_type:complete